MKIIDGIPVWGAAVDEGALAQIKTCAATADHVALMADHHKGYAVPIGGVVAYKDAISPSGVGFDIGCGNKAILTDLSYGDIRDRIGPVMDEIFKRISFGIGRQNNERADFALLDEPHAGWQISYVSRLKELARNQLGTVGSGNHYVDIFRDELDRVWVGVHFGSRGFGHKIASHFLKLAGAHDGMDVEPCILKTDSDLGEQYINAMNLAGKYAYAGRDWVCNRVADILGAQVLDEVHNHHNFAWRERHGDSDYWVVRKGATPAFPGQKGFVGGSMGEDSVILEGIEYEHATLSLYSTVHGAGRVMGRMEAKGKQKGGVWLREPKVTPAMMKNWIEEKGVELRGAGVDESPHCYKRLDEVLAQHSDSVKILHRLTPVGVAMAGADTVDPYKD